MINYTISAKTMTKVNSDMYFCDKQNNPWARSYLFLVDLFYNITILLRDVLRSASEIVPGGGGSEARDMVLRLAEAKLSKC